MGNHCMGVVTDREAYEKVLIFGGISNQVGERIEDIRSALSNKAFLITLNSRSGAGKSLFKPAADQSLPRAGGSTFKTYQRKNSAFSNI